jgi:hypothetical protein
MRALRDQALDSIYALMARHPLRLKGWCACCVDRADVDALLETPLRELEWPLLKVMVWKGMSTMGDAFDYLHCLPRMLELTEVGDSDRWLVDEKFLRARPSLAEREAVAAFYREEFFELLVRDVFDDRVLAPLAQYQLVERAASILERAVTAPRWYARLVCELGQQQWKPASSAEAVLVDWALTTPRLDLLERAFFEATDPWEQEHFSTAVLVLEWF